MRMPNSVIYGLRPVESRRFGDLWSPELPSVSDIALDPHQPRDQLCVKS